MYSVLLYPNITYARNLEADSFVVVAGQLIRALNEVRDDLEFTALLPGHVSSWDDIHNVRQVDDYALPTYPNSMRCHFDVDAFKRAVDWKHESYDIVWNHLPEHAINIRNVFANTTNERPRMVGYCHWFEVPELVTFAATTLSLNLEGIAAMDECGLNSQWLKDLVLGHARRKYGTDSPFITALDRRMVPMHLGIDADEHDRFAPPIGQLAEPGLLVWNHRPDTYTGWPQMVRELDAAWERRQDFRVMVTLGAQGLARPWLVDSGITAPAGTPAYRREYLTALSRAWYGLPRVNCQWAVSVTDGMSMGVPYILPRDFCYPEMVGPHYPDALTYGRGGFAAALDTALDNPGVRWLEQSAIAANVAANLSWTVRAPAWSAQFDRAIARLPVMGDRSKRYADLLPQAAAGRSKADLMKHMGWGVGIPWTPYRNRLRADGVPIRHDRYGEAR